MRDVFVLGVGQTIFGKQPDVSPTELSVVAALAAIYDAEVDPKEIQTAYCGTIYSPPTTIAAALFPVCITKIPMYTVENACASGSSAVHLLKRDIEQGIVEAGIAVGVESLSLFSKKYGKGLLGVEGDMQAKLSLTMPSYFAMLCNRLMEERGATIKDICYPSIKNHKAGITNPFAQYKKEVTVETIMASPMIADPITTLQCCPQSDGAAAIILCSKAFYDAHNKKRSRPLVRIAGSAIGFGGPQDADFDPLAMEVMIDTAKTVYKQAGIEPKDLDLIELHDAFSGEELAAYEMLGLCDKGEGVSYARSGEAEMGGSTPVNPCGGLLSLGHPLGASGVRVVNDVAKQLWEEAGDNQVEGAKVGMAQMLGGVLNNLESPIIAGIQILMK
jgi:benzoylsuccinyl-CoA thiolase BbsB subunit